MRTGIVVLLAVALSGCVGVSGLEAVGQYDHVEAQPFMNMTGTWRISDKPAEGQLMITTSFGRKLLHDLISPLDFTGAPKSVYQTAVAGWLANKGRACTVTDGYVLAAGFWEFKYSCP